jgi:hypothetical protein
MHVDRSAALSALLALVAASATQCSNVAGSGGGAQPGCPVQTADAAAGGDDGGAGGDDAGGDDGGGDDGGASPCAPPDSDGIVGGCYAFTVAVDETGFSPIILKAQNNSQVTLTLKNAGTKPHDLVMGCVDVHYPGCPAQFCFPPEANIPSVAPGESATTTYTTPYVEGIYTFASDLPGDAQTSSDGGMSGLWGQFVLQ